MLEYWSDGSLEHQRSNTPTIQDSSCSDTAYRLGAPDGSISLASLAANVQIAAFGGANRVRTKPWVPLVAALKAAGEALAAGWHSFQMPAKGKGVVRLPHRGRRGKHWHRGFNHPEARKAITVSMSETTKTVIGLGANRVKRVEER